MFVSAWKKFINKNDLNLEPKGGGGTPPGVHKLDKELQRKFARGVNYNMKIVIKGDRRVGKTSLFLRLKGYGFEDNYEPTENLNVTSIDWSYKATDDIVKIDLWEAVDVTSKRDIQYIDLKIDNNENSTASVTNDKTNSAANPSFDDAVPRNSNATITAINLSLHGSSLNSIPMSAKQSLAEMSEHLDVYKGADAVILMMDMTKSWTFKYVQNELPKVPKHIPILVIANHRDQGHHRTVLPEQVQSFIDGLDRTPCDGMVMYTESSMKNGFGLKLIEKFFNIPFLKLQERSLLKQIELNRRDFLSTMEELQIMQELNNREYELYLERRTIMKRQQADAMSPVNSGIRQLDETTREQIRTNAVSSSQIDRDPNVKSIESSNNFDKQMSTPQVLASQKFVNNRTSSIVMGAKNPLPDVGKVQLSTKPMNKPVESGAPVSKESISEDSDEEEIPRGNPLVADCQSDIDSDDQGAAS